MPESVPGLKFVQMVFLDWIQNFGQLVQHNIIGKSCKMIEMSVVYLYEFYVLRMWVHTYMSKALFF